ncbi:uncharacterized protein LOC100899652 isoform X2 [Galendromus occidentalis]|nr:uncharacterized protein LOC100899652 isoform X2 [Galendromus occidentalis]
MEPSQLLVSITACLLLTAMLARSETPDPYHWSFFRELLVPPEIDACLKEHNIRNNQIKDYLELVGKMKMRCDRQNVEFEQCLNNFRRMDDPRGKFKPVDEKIQACQRKIELEGRR